MKDVAHAVTPPNIKEKEAHGIHGSIMYGQPFYSWTT